MTANAVITPIVHLNGDTYSTLSTNLERVYDALREAEKALQQAAPNSRNFYVEPGRFEQALHQHHERMAAIGQLMDSVANEMNQLYDETTEDARRR